MKFSVDNILSTATAMALTSVISIVFISIRQSQKVRDTGQSISHTEQILTHIQKLVLSVVGNETGARGYVITGQDQFLHHLQQSENEIHQELEMLGILTANDAAQRSFVDSLAAYIEKRIAFSNRMVMLRRDKGGEVASQLATTGEGVFYTNKIQRLCTGMEAQANLLLGKRKNSNENVFRRLNFILYFLLAAGLILSILFVQKIRTDIKWRQECRLTEQRMIKLNAELEGEVLRRTEQLRKTNEELEAFSYSVSHDLRAPLRAIIGFTVILEEDYGSQLDSEAVRITSVIKANTVKMGQLIDDLLAFSRTGKQGLNKTAIDTSLLVSEIVDEFVQHNDKCKRIQWQIHPLHPANADRNTIRQVWVNLITNAVKYSTKGKNPLIEIGSYLQEQQVVYYVKDNGVGFDEKYKHKLFKVFQRLHRSEDFEGTGVGLALVEKIVGRHGGEVWAEGKVDQGACFSFSLPA